MIEYPKIEHLLNRDENNKYILGSYSKKEFYYLANNEWYFTEKIAGINIRILYRYGCVHIKGKNRDSIVPDFVKNYLNTVFYADRFKKLYDFQNICLYGECFGAGIKRGGLYSKELSFIVFDALMDNRWFLRPSLEQIALNFNIDIVPIVGKGTLQDAYSMVKLGLDSKWGNFKADGLVVKPYDVDLRTSNSRLVAKIKFSNV